MKKSRIILVVVLGLGGTIGIFSAAQPAPYLERTIEVNAPESIVKEKVTMLGKNIDSTVRQQFKFDFKPSGDKTQVVWGYTPKVDDSDNMLFKLVWIFKKDNMAKEMDNALLNIKTISEKAAIDSVQRK